jgi:putative tricarboxylic transport membrane protein
MRSVTTLRRVDMISGGILGGFGIFVVAQSLRLDFYTDGVPGPGFFPCLLGIALTVCGAILTASRWIRPKVGVEEFPLPSRDVATRSLGLWMSIFAASLLIGWLGFALTTVLLVAVILFGIERRRGLTPVIATIVIPLLTWLLFGWLLQVPLPTGLFGS